MLWLPWSVILCVDVYVCVFVSGPISAWCNGLSDAMRQGCVLCQVTNVTIVDRQIFPARLSRRCHQSRIPDPSRIQNEYLPDKEEALYQELASWCRLSGPQQASTIWTMGTIGENIRLLFSVLFLLCLSHSHDERGGERNFKISKISPLVLLPCIGK